MIDDDDAVVGSGGGCAYSCWLTVARENPNTHCRCHHHDHDHDYHYMEESYEEHEYGYSMTTTWMMTTLHFDGSPAGDMQCIVFDAAAAAAEAGGGDCENQWQHVHSPVCIISMLQRSSH